MELFLPATTPGPQRAAIGVAQLDGRAVAEPGDGRGLKDQPIALVGSKAQHLDYVAALQFYTLRGPKARLAQFQRQRLAVVGAQRQAGLVYAGDGAGQRQPLLYLGLRDTAPIAGTMRLGPAIPLALNRRVATICSTSTAPVTLAAALGQRVGLTVPRGVDEPPIEKAERVTTVPHLVQPELVFALVAIAGLLLWAMWVPAPLEDLADPDHAPNPAKAAWYLLGLQELLLHFHPLIAAVVIPALALGTLALLPYLDADMDSVGIWFRSRRGRHLALVSVIVGVLLTPALVLLDKYVLNLPALLPSLPTLVSNGVVPLAASLLGRPSLPLCRSMPKTASSATARPARGWALFRSWIQRRCGRWIMMLCSRASNGGVMTRRWPLLA